MQTQETIVDRLEEILTAVRDITRPNRVEAKLLWRENVRLGCPYYPQFMQVSLATREASRDRHLLEEKLKILSRQNRTTPIIKLLSNVDAVFPSKWIPDGLKVRTDQLTVFDFKLGTGWRSVDLIELLLENVRIFPEFDRIYY
jgi:hypothetical protein